jgi:hypothetical protein
MKDSKQSTDQVLMSNTVKQSKYQRELVIWTRISGSITITLIIIKLVGMI